MDELDTQLAQDLQAQREEGQEPEAEAEPALPEQPQEPEQQQPKTFDENYVKALRAENAKYRRMARDAEARLYQPPQPQPGQDPQVGQGQPQEYYDPRVDDLLLDRKISDIKADPYFSELFAEVDDEGMTFQERLLERAAELQWPISELDALAFKMEKDKLLGKVKQKGIDEAYKSMSAKAAAAPERVVSSGATVTEGEVKNVDDAFNKAKKELGVTNLSNLG